MDLRSWSGLNAAMAIDRLCLPGPAGTARAGVAAWASRKDLAYGPRGDEYTPARGVPPAP